MTERSSAVAADTCGFDSSNRVDDGCSRNSNRNCNNNHGRQIETIFRRNNTKTDRFVMHGFHHIEYYCGDALNTSKRFGWGLEDCGKKTPANTTGSGVSASACPHPSFSESESSKFVVDHGLSVKAIGIAVEDASSSYHMAVANGAIGVLAPYISTDRYTGKTQVFAEIQYVGDTVIRFVSGDFEGPFLANYETVRSVEISYGLKRLDHAVSNVPDLFKAVDYVAKSLGLHEFSEFSSKDVGTIDSGLNTLILANNNEKVLLPINEPTSGTRRKSQIQSFLEYHKGPGFQHLALKTDDIIHTIKELKKRSLIGGFNFMPPPGSQYYQKIEKRLGLDLNDLFSSEQLKELEELGILVDRDSEGWILQIFTEPIGDRQTIFLEIIQRIGCDVGPDGEAKEQAGGCGGFGKGNFSELFKAVEDFEVMTEDAAASFLSRNSSQTKLSSDGGDSAV